MNLIIIFIILISFISLVRYFDHDNTIIGKFPYYHKNIADNIREKGLIDKDSFTIDDRPYLLNPFHLITSLMSDLISVENAIRLFPPIIGLFCLIIFYLLLKNLGIPENQRFYSVLLLAISPIFINTSISANPGSLAVLLNMIGSYFFLKTKKIFFIISLICFAIIPLFGITHLAVSIIILVMLGSYNYENKKKAFQIMMVIIIISFMFLVPFYINNNIPKTYTNNLVIENISDLGAAYGYGAFIFILSLIGGFLIWKGKKHNYSLYLSAVLLLGLSLFSADLRLYSNFFLSFLAAIAFLEICKMRWDLEQVKIASIFLIACGILFSSVSFTNNFVHGLPDEEIIDSLIWLEKYDGKNSIVLSHIDYGFWIEDIAEKRVVLDLKIDHIKDFETKQKDIEEIFYSRDIQKTKNLLIKYNISYIFIDQYMLSELIWSKKEQGLLFLFRDIETFENIYDQDQIQIWKVNKDD